MLKDYLESTIKSWEFIGHPALLERFAVKHGTEFVGAPRPKGVKRGTPKECFSNSARIVPREEYWEGFAMHPTRIPFPFLHAWNMKRGRVIDRTLLNPEEYVYIGIKFAPEVLWREQLKHKVYGVLDTGMINVDVLREIDASIVEEAFAMARERRRA